MEIPAVAGYQGLGVQTSGRVVTPPHRKFKRNAPDWYEELYEWQRKAQSSRRIRVEPPLVTVHRHLWERTIQGLEELLRPRSDSVRRFLRRWYGISDASS
ncbi:transposase [Streptomyces sp. Ru71]|uniref:transposase n=1 Tax=Streptomyces sp. Ru71 TaxID=2080746 RepID=UPI0021562BF8|nr:transposase [Streptomyces sp. Ru71]